MNFLPIDRPPADEVLPTAHTRNHQDEEPTSLILSNPQKWLEDHIDFAVLSKLDNLTPDASCPDISLLPGWIKGRLQRMFSNPSLVLTREEAPWLEHDFSPVHKWWESLLIRPPTAELHKHTKEEPRAETIILVSDPHWEQVPTDARSYLTLPSDTAPWKHLAILLAPVYYRSLYVGFEMFLANGPKDSLLYLAGMSPFDLSSTSADYWLRCVHTATTRQSGVPPHPIYLRKLGTLHYTKFSGYPLAVTSQGNATALAPLHEALTLNLIGEIGAWASVRRIRTAVANFSSDNGFELIAPRLHDYLSPMRNLVVSDQYLVAAALASQGYGLDKAMTYGMHRANLKKVLISQPATMELVNVSLEPSSATSQPKPQPHVTQDQDQ